MCTQTKRRTETSIDPMSSTPTGINPSSHYTKLLSCYYIYNFLSIQSYFLFFDIIISGVISKALPSYTCMRGPQQNISDKFSEHLHLTLLYAHFCCSNSSSTSSNHGLLHILSELKQLWQAIPNMQRQVHSNIVKHWLHPFRYTILNNAFFFSNKWCLQFYIIGYLHESFYVGNFN